MGSRIVEGGVGFLYVSSCFSDRYVRAGEVHFIGVGDVCCLAHLRLGKYVGPIFVAATYLFQLFPIVLVGCFHSICLKAFTRYLRNVERRHPNVNI